MDLGGARWRAYGCQTQAHQSTESCNPTHNAETGGAMYLSQITIKNFRQFGAVEPVFSVQFHQGVPALVGENDVGKTAVIDAIRHVLLTRDMEFMRLQVEDFHIQVDGQQVTEITISCKLSGLTTPEKGAFAEYLTYEGQDVALYVHWFARRLSELPGSRRWVDIAVRSGPDGSGPALDNKGG